MQVNFPESNTMSIATVSPEVHNTPPLLHSVPDLEMTDAEIEHFFNEIEATKQQTTFNSAPEHIGSKTYDNGYVERYGYIDNAGYARSGLIGIPYNAETDIPVMYTPAWWTSGGHGHNLHTGLKFLDNGVPFIVSGAEGSYRPSWWKIRPPKMGINLTNAAASLLMFGRYAAQEHGYLIHEKDREIIGESRGGMVGMGAIALAESFGQNIVMADLTAACFPRPFEKDDIGRFKDQLTAEPKTMLGLAGKLAMRLLVHYPQTLDPHPLSVLHQLGMAPALMSGEAGDLSRMIDSETIIHLTCFDDDYASMPDEQAEVLDVENYENRRITLLKGSHLTIADPETLRFILARNKAYRMLRFEGMAEVNNMFPGIVLPRPDTPVTGDNVFELSHHIVTADNQLAA